MDELARAAIDDEIEKVKLILKEQPERAGEALSYAAFAGRNDLVKYLIGVGANINHIGSYGATPLTWYCLGADLDMIEYLIESGADANIPDNEGNTAWMHAVSRGGMYKCMEAAKVLVKALAKRHKCSEGNKYD
jgi:ankyrin repeat protein